MRGTSESSGQMTMIAYNTRVLSDANGFSHMAMDSVIEFFKIIFRKFRVDISR